MPTVIEGDFRTLLARGDAPHCDRKARNERDIAAELPPADTRRLQALARAAFWSALADAIRRGV